MFGDQDGSDSYNGGYGALSQYSLSQANAQNKSLQAQLAALSSGGGGYGGVSYAPNAWDKMPGGLQGKLGYGGAADAIFSGSRGADDEIRQGYDAILRQRAEGLTSGLADRERSYGAQASASGYSSDLAGRMSYAGGMADRAKYGSDAAGDQVHLHEDLAKLLKGTGTEIAGLKQEEIGTILSAIYGDKAAKAAKGSGLGDLASIVGAVGSFF